jgi:hypothetical protein
MASQKVNRLKMLKGHNCKTLSKTSPGGFNLSTSNQNALHGINFLLEAIAYGFEPLEHFASVIGRLDIFLVVPRGTK